MYRKRVIKSLISLGFSETDANVYIYLATNGPTIAEKIGDALQLKEQFLFQSLERLTRKGIVSSLLKQSILFSALPFEKTLELLVEEQLKEAENLVTVKNEIFSKRNMSMLNE